MVVLGDTGQISSAADADARCGGDGRITNNGINRQVGKTAKGTELK
jgi:hypothetical protein